MADTFILAAHAIYKATHLFSSLPEIGINVSKLQGFSPRYAWVKRYLVSGQNQVQALITFDPTSAETADPNVLQGVYVEVSGEGVVIDCISIDNFIAAADGNGNITTRYWNAGGIPNFVSPTPNCFIIARLDDGTGYSHDTVVMDYVTQYIGSVVMVSHLTGTSLYKISSYTTPVPIGGDVIETC